MKMEMEKMQEVEKEMEKRDEMKPTSRLTRQKNTLAMSKKVGMDDCMTVCPMRPRVFKGVLKVLHSMMVAPRVKASVSRCQSAKLMLAVSLSEAPV